MLLALALLALPACRHSPTMPTGVETPVLRLETPGFRLFAGRASDSTLRELADRLARARPRMAADLGVDEAAVGVNVTHELAHAISLRLQPDFANYLRWLWEAVALYENGELVDPRSLGYMRQAQPPTLQALSASITSGQQIYEVGYTLAVFVVARRGQEGLRELIRQRGDTEAVLQLSAPAFEQAWYAFVRERYGL